VLWMYAGRISLTGHESVCRLRVKTSSWPLTLPNASTTSLDSSILKVLIMIMIVMTVIKIHRGFLGITEKFVFAEVVAAYQHIADGVTLFSYMCSLCSDKV